MADWTHLLRAELGELTSCVPADPPGVRIRPDANEAPPLAPAQNDALLEALDAVSA